MWLALNNLQGVIGYEDATNQPTWTLWFPYSNDLIIWIYSIIFFPGIQNADGVQCFF